MKYRLSWMLLALLAISFLDDAQADGRYIWWEGENLLETNFPASTWFSTGAISSKQQLLSGGAWLTNDGKRAGAEAYIKYNVNIPQAGEYDFWARKFWKHGPFRWRFQDQEWRVCSKDVALADNVDIQQFITVNWVYLGKVSLPQGAVTLEIRLLAQVGESLTACFDCFLLTQNLFIPRGKLKPDGRSGEADEGFFPWEPPVDAFSADALLDLRGLNEKTAGMNGFVQRDGERFRLGDGTPVRFWAVNASSSIAALDRRSIDYMARRLAKAGVNMARYHSPIFDANDPTKTDPKKLDDLFYLIHALKREGIYTTISFYFPLWLSIKPQYGIPGYETISNKYPFALLYFDPSLQGMYKTWAKALLTAKNPYTGVALAQEPAVAIVEIVNEDSYFFWTFTKNNLPPTQWRKLETIYGQWLVKKYGSLEKAYAAWGGQKETGDDAAANAAVLYEAWNMTGAAIKQSNPAKVKRVGDQVRFLTENQRDFYVKTKDYFTQELGSKCLVSPSNWSVSDPAMLDALERYTYTAGDVIDKHGYFGGEHTSSDGRSSYSVAAGHTFKNLAAVTVPQSLPLQFAQIENYPHIITEIGWTNPNLYRADYAFLAAAYGSLQDVDGFYAFALGGAFWDASMEKFALSCPVILGNFPAYALLYRRGDIQPAAPVIRQVLDLEDLFAMKGSGASAAQALDDLRLKDVPPGADAAGTVTSIDPFSFYVGRAARTFGTNTQDSREMNLSNMIDRDKKTIASLTGELFWDYGKGLVTVNTPKSRGCAGFLRQAGAVDLSRMRIESQNEYGSVMLTALDNKPLEQSQKILIQAMTVERPYGFRAANGKDGEITNMGGYPFGVEKINVRITCSFEGGENASLQPLDENGYAVKKPATIQGGKNGEPLVLSLAEDSVYHLLLRPTSSSVKNWPKN